MRRLLIAGLGWHARRVYYPWLEAAALEGRLKIAAVVDREPGRAAVERFLAGRAAKPERLLFASERAPMDQLDPLVQHALDRMASEGAIDGVLISTDPLAHKAYARWALSRGLPVLMDKPLTAPDPLDDAALPEQLLADYREIAAMVARSGASLSLVTQRRAHRGYRLVAELVRDAIARFGVPLSFLDLYHADGMWVMPDEWDRDHHPYKYRSGKLLHSGYHFVDLAAWLLQLNGPLATGPATLELSAQAFRARDFVGLLDGRYPALLGVDPQAGALRAHGELDLTALGRLIERGLTRTTLSLQLLQCSFSRRASAAPAADPYKGAGRVRHERATLQLGPLMSVQVHSYQSHEVGDPSGQPDYGPGHIDHFDVHVFRNAGVIGGPAFERLEIGRAERSQGHNEEARVAMLDAFLRGEIIGSSLADHAETVTLLAALYQAAAARERGEGMVRLPWGGAP